MKLDNHSAQKALNSCYKMGGVLRFMVYDDASGDEAAARAVIHDTLAKASEVDDAALRALSPRNLNDFQFSGDWYNPSDVSLIWNGNVTTATGQQLTRPSFAALSRQKIGSSSAGIPAMSEDGQFACAFANPPYGLSGPSAKVQCLFEGIHYTLLPKGHVCVISDWASVDLDTVSNYFKAGKEW